MSTDAVLFPNGYSMPVLGFGTHQMAEPLEMKQTINMALDAGYRLFDTAAMYGNEQYIGETLRMRIEKGTLERQEVFITTKLALIDMGSSERVRDGVRRSCEALQVDYIDLLLIHWPTGFKWNEERVFYPMLPDGRFDVDDVDYIDAWKVLEELVDEGRIRSLGVSNFNSEQIERVCTLARHPICNLQVECHVYLQQAQLREFCRARDITVTSYFSLGAPAFLNKLSPEDQPLQDPVVAEIAKKYKKSPAQILLRFLIQEGVVVIPKSVTPSRMKENIQVFDFTMASEDMARLRCVGERNKRLFGLRDELSHAKHYPFNIPY